MNNLKTSLTLTNQQQRNHTKEIGQLIKLIF